MPTSMLVQPTDDLQSIMEKTWTSRRRAVTVGGEMATEGWELGFHSHEKAQLMLSLSGVVTCEVEGGVWIVPPESAIFIPGNILHRLAVAGNVRCYVTLIEAGAARSLPSRCSTITVSPLLRELVLRCSDFPIDDREDSVESRVIQVMLDEIATAPTGTLHLPMPSDLRLRAIFEEMMKNPNDRGTIESWARRVGLGERTLERMIAAETGMSFGRWRQQLNVLLALQWMADGATVQQVAIDLGYESAGSFVTMFRKALGTSPARYMSERFK